MGKLIALFIMALYMWLYSSGTFPLFTLDDPGGLIWWAAVAIIIAMR